MQNVSFSVELSIENTNIMPLQDDTNDSLDIRSGRALPAGPAVLGGLPPSPQSEVVLDVPEEMLRAVVQRHFDSGTRQIDEMLERLTPEDRSRAIARAPAPVRVALRERHPED